MKANLWSFLVLVLAILAGQFIANKFILRGSNEVAEEQEVSSTGDPVTDFLNDY